MANQRSTALEEERAEDVRQAWYIPQADEFKHMLLKFSRTASASRFDVNEERPRRARYFET